MFLVCAAKSTLISLKKSPGPLLGGGADTRQFHRKCTNKTEDKNQRNRAPSEHMINVPCPNRASFFCSVLTYIQEKAWDDDRHGERRNNLISTKSARKRCWRENRSQIYFSRPSTYQGARNLMNTVFPAVSSS